MNEIMTGPMSDRSYQTLERECLSGPVLESTTGEVGLAVAYKNSAFRLAAIIVDVERRADANLINADVLSLDGRYFQEMTFEADRTSGVIWARSLGFGPIVCAGSKPRRACFYDGELSEIPREDSGLTELDESRIIGLVNSQRGGMSSKNIPVPYTGGTITSGIQAEAAETSLPSNPRWSLFAGILPVRLPKQ